MFDEDGSGAPADGPAATLSSGDKPAQLAQAQLAQAPGDPIGTVEELTGSVTLTRADGSSTTAAPGDPVYLDDVVSTATGSSVEIRFVDDTRFSLGQNGQMTLDTLVYNPGGDGNELDLSVVQGAFTFVTGAIAGAPGEGMEVRVPVGTIGIRGTAVGGGPDATTADPSDYTIVLLPEAGGRVGRIVLTDLNGRSVILDVPLEAMDISSLGLAPGEPVQLTREQVIDLLGGAVENIEDILDIILNFESPEEENPEAGPQEGELIPSVPNNGGIRTQLGENQTLDELTTLFTLSDEQGFGANRRVGGFTPTGGLGGSQGGQQGGDDGDTGPQQTFDPVTIDDSSGLTVITGTDEGEVLDGSGGGPAQIVGLAGDDELIGSSGNDILLGGDGDDILDAGAGDDQVFGQGGNDLIIGGSGEGNDALDGGAGIDTVTYASATQPITVNLTAGTASGDPAIGSDTLVNIENVIGGQAGDIIIGDEVANVLDGGEGNDILSGQDGDDTLIGGLGNDTLLGDDGDDTLNGGSGNDTLSGDAGNDTLNGGSGNDVAVFSGNRDDYTIVGAEGGGFIVTDNRAGDNDGVDFVAADVELLRFADQDVGGGANDTLATAQVIARSAFGVEANPDLGNPALPSVAVGGAIFQNNDMDFFQVALQAGERLILDVDYGMNFGVSVDTIVTIYDAQGDVLAANDDADTSNGGGGSFHRYDAYLEFTVPADGVYYISVTSYSNFPSDGGVPSPGGGGSAGDYVLNVSIQPTEGSTGLGGAGNGAVSDLDQGLMNANDPPAITSDGGQATAAHSVAENGTAVTTVAASDPDAGQTLTFSIAGGADAALFAIDPSTGVLSFIAAPDFEAPGDIGADNVYDVLVQVDDGAGGVDTQALSIAVTNANDAPTITSNGGGDTTALSVPENGTAVTTVTAADPDVGQTLSFSIIGGADATLFTINPITGELSFLDAPDFETAADADTDNVYDVQVQVDDGAGGVDSQALAVTVTDVQEGQEAATEGAAIRMKNAVAVEADAVLTLRFNFLDSEPADDEPDFKDFAVLFINGQAFKLADVDDATRFIGPTTVTLDDQFNEQTGYGTFTFTFTEAGTYAIGIAVLNEGDSNYDAGLLIDEVVISNDSFSDGFESGLGNWDTLGKVTVESAVGGVAPSGGEQQVLLVSAPIAPQAIEEFLNVPHGTLSNVANQPVATENVGFDYNTIDGDDTDNDLVGTAGPDHIRGFGGNDTLVGLAGDDILDGGEGIDTLNGGDGNDTLQGTAGIDTFNGGAGNDWLVIDALIDVGSDASMDGGEGNDTLLFAGEGIDISLSDGLPIYSIERIDITGGGANSIALSAADVLGISDVDTLVIFGDDDDTVTLTGGGWHPSEETSIDGVQCFRYDNDNGAQVFIDTEILNQNIS